MENNHGQGASKSRVGSYMKINNGKGGSGGGDEGKDAAGELRKKTIMRRTEAEDVSELADDFIKMENNNQGTSKNKVGSYKKINNEKAGGSEEGKDAAGELRKKTIMRQMAEEAVNELAEDFIKMENNNEGAFKTKVGSNRKINNGKGTGSEEGKDAAGELRKKMIMRQMAAEAVNELAEDFIKMENNNEGASKTKVGSNRKINNGKGTGSEEGKDNAGELRKKTIMRQIAAEDVNELADDFIKNFRKQLKIERADSIKRFREMIDRGA